MTCIAFATRNTDLEPTGDRGWRCMPNAVILPTMKKRPRPETTHNPSAGSTQRWDNEGGAIKGVRARPRDPAKLAKGGQARAKNMSSRKRAEIAERTAQKRDRRK
jgi:hypothetical protein